MKFSLSENIWKKMPVVGVADIRYLNRFLADDFCEI